MDSNIASRKRRLFAIIIDTILYYSCLAIAASYILRESEFVFNNPWMHTIWILLGTQAIFAAKDCYKGASPGKLMLGIRVVALDGSPTALWQSYLRNISLLFWPIEAIAIVVSSNKRRLGDYFANTHVLRDETISLWQRAASALVVLIVLQATPSLPNIDFSPESFQELSQQLIKSSSAYKAAEHAVYQQPEIEGLIGAIQSIDVGNNTQINTHNDDGQAHFQLIVNGSNESLPVFITLKLKQGEWMLESLQFEQSQPMLIQ